MLHLSLCLEMQFEMINVDFLTRLSSPGDKCTRLSVLSSWWLLFFPLSE